MKHPVDTPFECIESRVGGQLWRLQDPGTSTAERAEIEAHLEICHACRLVLQVDAAVTRAVGHGVLDREPEVTRIRAGRPRLAQAAVLASLPLAACLAGMLLLPPRPIHGGAVTRGTEETRFLRPVEGEIVATSQPSLRWTPVAGASRYEVELRDRSGKPVWRGESVDPSIRTDGTPSLPPGGEYRALLSVQPADLLPPGRVSVAFKTGTLGEAILHRLRWAHPVLQAAGLIAAALLVFTLTRRRRNGLSSSTA